MMRISLPPPAVNGRTDAHMDDPMMESVAGARAGEGRPVRRPEPGGRVREGFPGQRLTVLPPGAVRRGRELPVVSDLYVTDIGHFPHAPRHFVERPEGRAEAILIYASGGVGWCEMEGKEWCVTEGSALLIPPGTPHVYGADASDPWVIWWVHFGGVRMLDYLRVLGVSAARPLLFVPDVHRILDAFAETYAWVTQGYTEVSQVGLSTSLVRLLGLLRGHQRSPDARTRRTEELVRRTIRFMRDHLAETRSLRELADLAELSVPHYSALFRRLTGSSPGRFYSQLKIQRACELLDTTDRPIASIAEEVGYPDPFHFSRIFKQVVGKPPSEYRRVVKG
jgi:AraC-like DNA-binding protein